MLALEAESLGIISIKLLSISFTANLTAFIIDCPSSLFDPDNGTKRPILIFSEALTENENNMQKFSDNKKINNGKIGDITLKLAKMYTEACINGQYKARRH